MEITSKSLIKDLKFVAASSSRRSEALLRNLLRKLTVLYQEVIKVEKEFILSRSSHSRASESSNRRVIRKFWTFLTEKLTQGDVAIKIIVSMLNCFLFGHKWEQPLVPDENDVFWYHPRVINNVSESTVRIYRDFVSYITRAEVRVEAALIRYVARAPGTSRVSSKIHYFVITDMAYLWDLFLTPTLVRSPGNQWKLTLIFFHHIIVAEVIDKALEKNTIDFLFVEKDGLSEASHVPQRTNSRMDSPSSTASMLIRHILNHETLKYYQTADFRESGKGLQLRFIAIKEEADVDPFICEQLLSNGCAQLKYLAFQREVTYFPKTYLRLAGLTFRKLVSTGFVLLLKQWLIENGFQIDQLRLRGTLSLIAMTGDVKLLKYFQLIFLINPLSSFYLHPNQVSIEARSFMRRIGFLKQKQTKIAFIRFLSPLHAAIFYGQFQMATYILQQYPLRQTELKGLKLKMKRFLGDIVSTNKVWIDLSTLEKEFQSFFDTLLV